METSTNIPGDALPVRNLFSSVDNAAMDASICDTAFALIEGPTLGGTSIVPLAASSSIMSEPGTIRKQNTLKNDYDLG